MSYNPDLHGFIDMSTTTLHESRVCMELLYFTCWPGPIFDPCRNGTQQPSLPVRRHPDCSWLVAWVQLPCEIAGWSPQPWSWMKLDSFREDLGGIPQRDPKGAGKPARKEPAQQRSAAPEALGVGPVQNLGTTDVWRCLHQAHWMGAGWPRLQGWTQQVDAWSVWLEVGSWPCPKNVLTMAKWLAFAEKSWAFIALRGCRTISRQPSGHPSPSCRWIAGRWAQRAAEVLRFNDHLLLECWQVKDESPRLERKGMP